MPDAEPFVPPRCTIVISPHRALLARWLRETFRDLRVHRPATACALLDVGDTLSESPLAPADAGMATRRLLLPCPCCPAAAELPRHVRALVNATDANWIFIALPALTAAGLIAEFDALLRWPREVVLCLGDDWLAARQQNALSFFQFQLIGLADRVVAMSDHPAVAEILP